MQYFTHRKKYFTYKFLYTDSQVVMVELLYFNALKLTVTLKLSLFWRD